MPKSSWNYTCTGMKVVLFIGAIIAVFAIAIGPLSHKLEISINVELCGREKEQSGLLNEILHGKHMIIEVIGIAGVGKTVLALNTTAKLVEEHNFCPLYADLSEFETISLLVDYLINKHDCIRNYNSVYLTLTAWLPFYSYPSNLLQSWYSSLKSRTVLVLDSADMLMEELEQGIIEPLSVTGMKTKIILIARYSKKLYLQRPVIPIIGMSRQTCANWISNKHTSIPYDKSDLLCHELGGVPREVELIAIYVMHPLTAESIGDVVAELKSVEYGKAFAYLESILGRHYKDTKPQNLAMYFLYNRLRFEDRECIWLLVEMRINGEFTKEMVKQHLPPKIDVGACLDSLLKHSFLEIIHGTVPNKIFRIRPYIKKFIQSIGEPSSNLTDVVSMAKFFYGNYVFNNARKHHSVLQKMHDLQLAIYIGSKKHLINSFLPLLGGKYELRPLFKAALEVIESSYCMPKSVWSNSNAQALLAFSYLTKAVHCPAFHPPALLSDSDSHKIVSKRDQCLHKLQSCPAILHTSASNYETAEALGYHNSLLIYAHNSTPWLLSLTDVSLIVTVANHECANYCNNIHYCSCGKQSSLEHGLRQFLLRNYSLSAKYFQYTLHQLSNSDYSCQTILKVIAIIGIYASKADTSVISHLARINFDTLNISCFLGLINDLVAPFLLKIGHESSLRFCKRVNETIREEEKHCNKKNTTDVEILDCSPTVRYTIGHGIAALKMTELQISSQWPLEVTEYDSREEWVCSIIRDKTTKCKEALPLFSEVRLIETNKNYEPLRAMKYFMDEEEYMKLRDRAYSVPQFFQLMSI